jgi:SAM-dependent methyltransferase
MNSQTPNRWFNPIRWQWLKFGRGYRRFMSDESESSTYLREVGLKPTLKRLLGDCSSEAVLDVGAGGAWLFKLIQAKRAVAFDLAPAAHYPPGIEYDRGDAAALSYPDDSFDTVVSNLMLCYCADLSKPLHEMARVTRPAGRLVISLVHPHFYRTGEGNWEGSFTITADLSRTQAMSIMIGNRVGPFRYFYHPYPAYLNALVEAGWVLRHAEDWFYDEADYRRHFAARDTVNRSPRVPIFTFLVCSKG